MSKNNKIKSLQELMVRCRHRCCICPEHKKAVELAHIKPKKKGGLDKPSNRIPVCRNCHGEIHTKRELTRNYTKQELKKYRNNWIKK